MQTINAKETVEKRKPSCTAYGNANWYSNHGEQYQDSLKTLELKLSWPSNPSTTYIPWEYHIEKHTCNLKLIATLFTITKSWKPFWFPSIDECIMNLWYLYTVEFYSAIKMNEFESVILRGMNQEPVEHSAVIQKEKKQILYINAYICNWENITLYLTHMAGMEMQI